MHRIRGLTRTVFLTRCWVVKVPRLASHGDGLAGVVWSVCRGVLANLSERLHSREEGVCPVRWSLAGLLNVYPRCAPVGHEPTEQEYADTGYFGPADKKRANVGYLGDRMVFVDFDQEWNDRPPCRHADESVAASAANGLDRGRQRRRNGIVTDRPESPVPGPAVESVPGSRGGEQGAGS